jgi:predicted PurR-regulated permease PerM
MTSTKIEVSVKTLLTILAVVAGVYLLSRMTDILTQIFIAFVLMTALNPLVNRLQRLKMSRVMAILTTYILFIGSLIVVFAALVPPLVDQTTRLFTQLNLPTWPIIDQIAHFRFSAVELWSLATQYGGSLPAVFSIVSSTFGVFFTFFTVLVMAVYLLLGRDHLYTYFLLFFRTSDKEDRSKTFVNRVENALGSWVRAEFLLMLAIGIMSFIGLTVLNIPYALPLAIFAGLMEALPNIGPTVAAFPAVAIAAISVSPIMAVVTAILFMLIQQIENNFIVPQVMKRTTGIRPLTTIVLILVGFRFGGVIGALLVVPIYIIIRECASEFSHEIKEITS